MKELSEDEKEATKNSASLVAYEWNGVFGNLHFGGRFLDDHPKFVVILFFGGRLVSQFFWWTFFGGRLVSHFIWWTQFK